MYYIFYPKKGFYFTKDLLNYILKNINQEKIKISIDLGLTWRYIDLDAKSNNIYIDDTVINFNFLTNKIRKESYIYFYDKKEEKIYPLIIVDNKNFYKLKPLSWHTSPTLEINGIHMHNIINTTPWKDSYKKTRHINPKNNEVILDICTGLGYTAIHSSMNAKEVITIEKDINVLELARYNPWSYRLASKNIKIILGDAYTVIDMFPDNSFHKVIHDPPRFSLAGELYSQSFYNKVHRVLKKGGLLFHYTGSPGKHRGLNIQKGIIKRLKLSGFTIVKIFKNYGIIAQKN